MELKILKTVKKKKNMNDTVFEGKLKSFSFQTQEQSSHAKMARRDHKDEILHGTEKETGS